MNAKTTKRARSSKGPRRAQDDLAPEYRLDYRKSKANRFARQVGKDAVVIVLDRDVSEVFRDSKQVNSLLRAMIVAVQKRGSKQAG